jgi:hypothetical protein
LTDMIAVGCLSNIRYPPRSYAKLLLSGISAISSSEFRTVIIVKTFNTPTSGCESSDSHDITISYQ